MADTFSAFESLRAAGLDEEKSAAIARQIGVALTESVDCNRESIADSLYGEKLFKEEQAEKIAEIISHCYWDMRFQANFNPTRLKTELVREGVPNVQAQSVLDAVDKFVRTPKNNEVRKPVKHAPGGGQVFMCDFRFLRKPEMQKERRAIILSPKSLNEGRRCIVVPVSMSQPTDETIHHRFEAGAYHFFHKKNPVWAVCDHVYTLSFDRLWYVAVNGKPEVTKLSAEDYQSVRGKVAAALQLESLTPATEDANS